MNEFNVLLAAATNGTPSGSLFDALFARYIAPQESWRELESPLPITILAAGEDLIDYRIYGNTESGESVGERTENLWDGTYYARSLSYIDGNYTYNTYPGKTAVIPCKPNTRYSIKKFDVSNRFIVTVGTSNALFSVTTFKSTENPCMITTSSDSNFIFVYVSNSEELAEPRLYIAEGSTAPTSYIPFGYKLPMVVRSGNLFDKNFEQGFYRLDDGGKGSSLRYVRSNDKIPVSSDETYTVTYTCPKEGVPLSGVGRDSYILFWEADSSYIGYQQIMEKGNQTFTTPSNAAYVGFDIGAGSSGDGTLTPSDVSNFMLNSGATALPYQPYSRTDIPIYIGSDPLAEDEYVDFGEQKVYHKVNGTLTPTDPPVPIPALPTIQGETIIDYNPSETPAVEPEKMYIKYKPQ